MDGPMYHHWISWLDQVVLSFGLVCNDLDAEWCQGFLLKSKFPKI